MGILKQIGGFLGGQLPVIGPLVQSAINAGQTKKNIERQNAFNRSMAEYEYSKNVEMWNRANEYNNPINQMARLKSAGLNPNLVYGSGTVAGNTAGQIPKYQAPQASFDFKPAVNLEALGEYQNVQMRQAQIDNARAQRRIIEANGVISQAKAMVAQEMEQMKAGITFVEMKAKEATSGWTQQEFGRMFEFKGVNEQGHKLYRIRPEMEETYQTMLAAKWTRPVYELQKTNADIANINALKDLRSMELDLKEKYGNAQNIMKVISGIISPLRLK